VSSSILATRLARHEQPPDGFVIEGPVAGGHNAPPRDKVEYGDRDKVNPEDIVRLSRPFWLAGGYDSPDKLKEAKDKGANGIQVGTAFLICRDSALESSVRDKIINQAVGSGVEVVTDMRASPTGLPFKVAQLPGTLSEDSVYKTRIRKCDLGYLREPYAELREDGTEVINYRCPAEPEKVYIKKGGDLANTIGRVCLCNGLLSTIGLGQIRRGEVEKPIITAGDILTDVARQLVAFYGRSFSAGEVVRFLRSSN